MSHYISTNNSLAQLEGETRSMLVGLLSRIKPTNLHRTVDFNSLDIANQTLLNKKTSKKLAQQQENAKKLNHFSLQIRYKNLKKKLNQYGVEDSLKMTSLFVQKEKENQTDIISNIKKAKRVSVKKQKVPQRTIFLDRKYNAEFSLKIANLKEMEEIKTIKDRKIKQREDYISPLVQNARRSFSFMKHQTEPQSPEKMTKNINPVLKKTIHQQKFLKRKRIIKKTLM